MQLNYSFVHKIIHQQIQLNEWHWRRNKRWASAARETWARFPPRTSIAKWRQHDSTLRSDVKTWIFQHFSFFSMQHYTRRVSANTSNYTWPIMIYNFNEFTYHLKEKFYEKRELALCVSLYFDGSGRSPESLLPCPYPLEIKSREARKPAVRCIQSDVG